MSSNIALELRKEVKKIDSIENFYSFASQFKNERKKFCFCFFTFIEKLILEKNKDIKEFVENIQDESIKKLCKNMISNWRI